MKGKDAKEGKLHKPPTANPPKQRNSRLNAPLQRNSKPTFCL